MRRCPHVFFFDRPHGKHFDASNYVNWLNGRQLRP